MADDHLPPDVSFTVTRHGFDRTQVKTHVRELTDRAERADADRAEARQQVAELQGELEIARREIAALSERLDALGTPDADSSASSARLVDVAKSQASEITTRARAAAEDSWAAAEKASSELREKYRRMLTELDGQHAEIHATHKSIITAARGQAEELTSVAERRRRELDAAAERDRVRIDREFSESMNAKRAALERELTQRREACVAEVEKKLRDAEVEAKQRMATVSEQVKRLTKVRTELSERLRGTQELLERSVDLLKPTEQEAELTEEGQLPMPEPPTRPDAPEPPEATEPAPEPTPDAVAEPTPERMPVPRPEPGLPETELATDSTESPVEPPTRPATEPATKPTTTPAAKPGKADPAWKPESSGSGNGERVPPQRARRSQPGSQPAKR
ncbi:hypothetical protein [Actinophytocola sp.]|uniref:hypothetical protein n=1 Tax=Actinophytocola sp. TaxID=1872138 RepID=UPI003D6AC44E